MTGSLILRFLHVLSAALWLGSALFWPGALRRALDLGPPHPAPALAQARVGLGLDLGAGLATVVTGLVYASPVGGAPIRHGLIVGLAFAALRLALLVAVARPAVQLAREAAGAGNLAAARVAAQRLPAYTGAAHLLWFLALATMIFPF